MAVIVRSVPRAGAALARALTAAGVPVDLPGAERPLADQPAVRALLTVLDATADGLDGERALALVTGPIGRRRPGVAAPAAPGAAPRRRQPADRRGEFADLLVEALDRDRHTARPTSRPAPLRRVARGAGGRPAQRRPTGSDPRYTLWQAWHGPVCSGAGWPPASAAAPSERRPTATSTP